MKRNRIASLALAVSFTVMTGYSQTASELMQKGIYTQETAGDLDGAISIYREIVNSGSSPRDIAAQAQYRMAQSLLQKGDLANASQEFEALARNYADYGKLIGSMATMARGNTFFYRPANGVRGGRGGGPALDTNLTPEQQAAVDQAKARLQSALQSGLQSGLQQQAADWQSLQSLKARIVSLQAGIPGGRGLFESMSFDSANPVVMTGTMFRMDFMNPAAAIFVKDGTGKRYAFAAAAPAEMTRQGWTRDSARPGDTLTIAGFLATGGQTLPDGTIAASATTITAPDGRKLFDRAAIPQ